MKPTRIVLTELDFKMLVDGGTVHYENVKIILQDIGFDRMQLHIKEAMNIPQYEHSVYCRCAECEKAMKSRKS